MTTFVSQRGCCNTKVPPLIIIIHPFRRVIRLTHTVLFVHFVLHIRIKSSLINVWIKQIAQIVETTIASIYRKKIMRISLRQ